MATLTERLTKEKILAHRLLLKEHAPYIYQYMQIKHPLPELEEKKEITKEIGGAETHQPISFNQENGIGNTATDRPTERK